ncbi:MAG TPA: hypothetical protein ENK43_17680 [Planctomycetes bacterium]|nr:hypothetical protein [Planctomycetota bacterium]
MVFFGKLCTGKEETMAQPLRSMKVLMSKVLSPIFAVLILAVSLTGQSTLYVDPAGSSGFSSIQAAINAATPGSLILVAPGTYDEGIWIHKSLTIRSTDGPRVTAIAPSSLIAGVRIFNPALLPFPTATLEGFRITASAPMYPAPFRAGGIIVSESNATIRNCIVTNCVGADGGFLAYGATGGVEITAFIYPGATHSVMENCIISNNHGGVGSPGWPSGAGGTGGITVNSGASLEVRHCTIVGNLGGDASGFGFGGPGGLAQFSTGILTLVNSIVWGNLGGIDLFTFGPGHFTGTPTFTFSDVQGPGIVPGASNFNADPMFTLPTMDDFSLQPGSPCIDAASCVSTSPYGGDLDGNPRVRGFGPDMGALEQLFDATRIGTSEDFLLTTVVNGNFAGGLVNTKNLAGGDNLLIHWESPCGTLNGAAYYLGAQLYVPGQEPVLTLPFFYIDGIGGSVIHGPAPLPPGGINLVATVPQGSFMPAILRLQALVVSPLAQTIPFVVTSDAQDLVLQ